MTTKEEYIKARNEAIEEILAEQCDSCLNWDSDNDKGNTVNDWAAFIASYATSAVDFRKGFKEQQEQFVKAGNLCLSALIAAKLNGKYPERHYD